MSWIIMSQIYEQIKKNHKYGVIITILILIFNICPVAPIIIYGCEVTKYYKMQINFIISLIKKLDTSNNKLMIRYFKLIQIIKTHSLKAHILGYDLDYRRLGVKLVYICIAKAFVITLQNS